MKNIELKTVKIETSSGSLTISSRENLKSLGLKDNHLEDINRIGYTGKLHGIKTNFAIYLNSLKIGKFVVEQIGWDTGDFRELFHITYAKQK